tara:strand:+ start:280 stop:696 length:417 start_codon:yes stop_codon:yes gene_type:complete
VNTSEDYTDTLNRRAVHFGRLTTTAKEKNMTKTNENFLIVTIANLESRIEALQAKNKELLEGSTWAHKEIAIMDRKHTVQVDKAEALWLKLDGALEALKTIANLIEYFAPARMAAGKGMAFFEEIEAKAGKAAGLPGY